MENLDLWCQRLIKHEGLSLMPYYCPQGKLTIGVGHCLDTNPLSFDEKRILGDYMHGITKNGAMMLLRNDILRTLEYLPKIIKNFDNLNDDRQYALVDLCFQLGPLGLKKFRKMISALNTENFDIAANECLISKYAIQTPRRARRIAHVIRTGKW